MTRIAQLNLPRNGRAAQDGGGETLVVTIGIEPRARAVESTRVFVISKQPTTADTDAALCH